MFFSAYTLGCKLNQLETEAISDSFRREGFKITPWGFEDTQGLANAQSLGASILLINTCTVTSMAEQKARRVIRKTLREYPGACLFVTGCYAQMEKAALLTLAEGAAGRLFVIPGEKKDRLIDLARFIKNEGISFPVSVTTLSELINSWLTSDQQYIDDKDGAFRFAPPKFSSRSRGFLKIQDGCDNSCAYCRVNLARGKSRSLGAKDVLAQLLSLEEQGYNEAVLAGVNVSQYNDSGMGFPGLLDFLLRETERIRLRLSSIEPDLFTEEFFRVLSGERIRPHFHLSVQSGSEKILAKMGRFYTPVELKNAVQQLRQVKHDPFLACDIIAGFPGEKPEDFEKTIEFCKKAAFAWIHAFPFSPRPGTAASRFSEKVNEKDKAARVGLLTELARKGRNDYLARWKGREVEAVVEGEKEKGKKGKELAALSENYLKLLVTCGEGLNPAAGSLIRCRISEAVTGRFDALAELKLLPYNFD